MCYAKRFAGDVLYFPVQAISLQSTLFPALVPLVTLFSHCQTSKKCYPLGSLKNYKGAIEHRGASALLVYKDYYHIIFSKILGKLV